jgi:hypothetical protein
MHQRIPSILHIHPLTIGSGMIVLKIKATGKKTGAHDEPAEQSQILLTLCTKFAIYDIAKVATKGSRYDVEKATVN